MCILFAQEHTLLKVVSYYELSVLSLHVSDGFPKKKIGLSIFFKLCQASPLTHSDCVFAAEIRANLRPPVTVRLDRPTQGRNPPQEPPQPLLVLGNRSPRVENRRKRRKEGNGRDFRSIGCWHFPPALLFKT